MTAHHLASPVRVGDRASSGERRTPLYQQLLGAGWAALPPSLQQMHDLQDTMIARGTAVIETGSGRLAEMVRHIFGFPQAARSTSVQVTFTRRGDAETWTRQFGSSVFSSVQRIGRGHDQGLVVEQFGPFSVGLALVVTDGRLSLVVRGWRLLGLRLPFAPGGTTYEFESNGRFHFHVEIRHPWIGLIVAYSGALNAPEPVGTSARAP